MNNLKQYEIEVEPVISYPRRAEVGKTYLMTIDLRPKITAPDEWQYEEEEYPIYCMLDTLPLFSYEAVGEPVVVLHRFGGSYGPATFMLTAAQREMKGSIRITLINQWGVPINEIKLGGIETTRYPIDSRKTSESRRPVQTILPADPLPSYKPDLFVNREDMIALVRQKARELAGGKSVRSRIDFFRGPKSSGKTWLLRQLAETILPALYGVRPVYINLEVLQTIPLEEALKEIMSKIIQTCFGAESEEMDWLIASAELFPEAQWKQFLTERLPRKNIILILCLDHVSETATERLQYLEKALLGPFVLRPDTYLIMTGRGTDYHWGLPDIQLYIAYHTLEPFNLPHIREQLKKAGFDFSLENVEKILADSTGYPGLIYQLAQVGEAQETVARAVENILSRLSPENREQLEVLSIPRTFTDELFPQLLAVYCNNPAISNWTLSQIYDALNKLKQAGMIRWEDPPANADPPQELSGYAVDQALRPLLEKNLKYKNQEMWRKLHCLALKYYRQLAHDFPEEAPTYRKEIDYHTGQLRHEGFDPAQCSGDSEERRNV